MTENVLSGTAPRVRRQGPNPGPADQEPSPDAELAMSSVRSDASSCDMYGNWHQGAASIRMGSPSGGSHHVKRFVRRANPGGTPTLISEAGSAARGQS